MADERGPFKPLLARLTPEESYVGVVACVQDYIRPYPAQFGDQAGKIRRGRRVTLFEHDLHSLLRAGLLIACGDACAVGSVFVDYRDLQIFRFPAELRLGVLAQEGARGSAELVRMHIRTE